MESVHYPAYHRALDTETSQPRTLSGKKMIRHLEYHQEKNMRHCSPSIPPWRANSTLSSGNCTTTMLPTCNCYPLILKSSGANVQSFTRTEQDLHQVWPKYTTLKLPPTRALL